MENSASAGLAPASGYPAHLDWHHAQFFPVRCPACGWVGMSNETEGGDQIADTGDYAQIVCPQCMTANGKGYMHDDAKWVPVEDLLEPDTGEAEGRRP